MDYHELKVSIASDSRRVLATAGPIYGLPVWVDSRAAVQEMMTK
jgi:hypothetical protein